MNQPLKLTEPFFELDNARYVASFLNQLFSSLGEAGGPPDISVADLEGISVIAGDIEARIEWSSQHLDNMLKRSEDEMLARVGLPEEAYDNNLCRKAWRDGYAHALRDKKDGK